jgi:hypothetical protein
MLALGMTGAGSGAFGFGDGFCSAVRIAAGELVKPIAD